MTDSTPHRATHDQWRQLRIIMELADRLAAAEQRIKELEGRSNQSAADVLTDQGCFAGQHGLEGLANADSFWDQQPYGTRLYYGDGIADYLHRSVLKSAIQVLEGSRPAPAAPTGSLVEAMRAAYERSSGTFLNHRDEQGLPGPDREESEVMILAVADWLNNCGQHMAAVLLRGGAERTT